MILLDFSHGSALDLDKAIVDFAVERYFYTLSEPVEDDDAEGWYWESEAAVDWMNSYAMENDSVFYVDDNSLYFDKDYAEISVED